MPDTCALEAAGVTVAFDRRAAVLDSVSFRIEHGAAVGLAGPSGCGKSTLARVLALLLKPSAGSVRLDGRPVTGWRYRAPREARTAIALIFQQPRAAVDPRLTLAEIVAEPLLASGRAGRKEAAHAAASLAERTGLTADLLGRRPHEVSDGQLQRACVARALALEPRYLVCDEMTSMLDASTQAFLVAAVEEYRARTGAGLLAISHDEALLARWCDEVRTLP
ncbi:ABC transporter ATP-binding protein [Rhizohabitans arisaemae]|uniref:ABC transporter ATP-binding protein n=1 Tax=Rhizohabitans arisaemae TaxID=2720610 RepID=UPI0024B0D0F4|nr:dipeptide/oligopeptide/nickel ABC transporter ATP-binding protein [Rhizohabitans arisaemae]